MEQKNRGHLGATRTALRPNHQDFSSLIDGISLKPNLFHLTIVMDVVGSGAPLATILHGGPAVAGADEFSWARFLCSIEARLQTPQGWTPYLLTPLHLQSVRITHSALATYDKESGWFRREGNYFRFHQFHQGLMPSITISIVTLATLTRSTVASQNQRPNSVAYKWLRSGNA